MGGLPIGLASRIPLLRDIPAGQIVSWNDVRADAADETICYRREMERDFASALAAQ